MMHLTKFAQSVLSYCASTHGSITSWYRTPHRNSAVGGVANSYHLLGLAIDVVYDEPIAIAVRKTLAERAGLLLIPESDHDHLQPFTS